MKAKTHKLTFIVSKEVKNKLKRVSRKEGRSMTAQVVKIIEGIPENKEIEKTTA